MASPFYSASVPVFLRYLERLARLVDLAQAHATRQGLGPAALMDARLTDDMLPFAVQVQVATNFVLRVCFPLAGRAVPAYGEYPASFDGLRSRIARVEMLVRSLPPADFDGAQARILHDKAGEALVSLPAPTFLFEYGLPNFFFHLSTAYAILRKLGLALSKGDFDGFHAYPTAGLP